jgi:hypothetical protein
MRRAAVVDTANAIGTTYLRAQTLREPTRTRGEALDEAPADSAPRLYVETLNEMIDCRPSRCPR